MRMWEWVKQCDGVLFQFSLQESNHYEFESEMVQREEGYEVHTDTEMDDNNDEDDHDDDDESEIDNIDDEDDTIFMVEPVFVAPKEIWTKRKTKYPILMNVVGLKSFTVENTQLLRRFSRPPRASEEDIGHWGLSIFKKNVQIH